MFYLKKILSALFLPPFGLMLAAALGLILMRRHRRFGMSLTLLSLALLALGSLPVVGNALQRSATIGHAIEAKDLAGAEAIVIVGGGKYYAAPEYGGGDTVSRYALERLRYGARLAKQSGLPVLVSGGAPFGGTAEAEAMRDALWQDFGVKTRWVERESRDTAENAALSAPLLRAAGVHRIVLVTQAWHMHRTAGQFAALGFDVIPAPCGFATDSADRLEDWLPDARGLERSSIAAREWFGELVRWVKAK